MAGSPYTSSCTGAADPNYAIGYVAGSVTVTPAPLTVTASSPHHDLRRHAAGDHAELQRLRQRPLRRRRSRRTHLLDDRHGSSAVAGSPYSSSCAGAVDPNYAISYVAGTVTVTQAPLTVTASTGTMTYGGTPPAVTPGYGGFKNGDTRVVAHATAQLLHDGDQLQPRRRRRPTPPSARAHPDPNYAITYVAGSVTVNTAPLSVTASSGTMAYGGTPPAITPSYSGFVNGDTPRRR